MPSNLQQALLECGCGCGTTCCTERCNPYISELHPGDCTGAPGENPLPSTLTVEATSDSSYGCWTLSGTVTLVENGRWALGQLTGTCSFCCPGNSADTCTWTFDALIQVNCSSAGGWILEFDFASSGPTTVQPPTESVLLTKVSCDPILLTGEICFGPGMVCAGLMPPVGNGQVVTHPDICFTFTVYETL
jgi:hypothetical protein